MHIINLPDDVLLHIALDLSIRDILSFKQTCRVLHTFGSADYLWHRLAERSGLLLNIPTETSIAALSADELQRIVIDAMRLEVNWTRPSPTIKRTISLKNEDNALFEHLQFVDGAKWLLVVQDRYHRFEERVYTKVAFWSLHNISDPRCVVQFELSGKYRASDVTLNSEEENATFALALTDARGDFLEIRTFSLNDEYAALSQITPFPSIARRIDLPASEELELCNMSITGLSVSGKVLAATVTAFTLDHHEASRILVARTDKGPAYWMGQQPYKPIHPALARLHNNDIIIFGHTAEGLACHTFRLPSILLCDYTPFMPPPSLSTASDTALAWGPLVGEVMYTGSKLNTLFPEPKTVPPVSSQTLAFVVVSDSQANLVRFPLNTRSNPSTPSTSPEKPRSHPLPVVLRPDTSIRLVGVGSSGRRAVWMEHDLETTRSRLMRLEVPHDNGVVGCTDKVMYKVLLPPDPPLPFSTDACQALAFDEASCRLCFGLWDGSLHVVDFL